MTRDRKSIADRALTVLFVVAMLALVAGFKRRDEKLDARRAAQLKKIDSVQSQNDALLAESRAIRHSGDTLPAEAIVSAKGDTTALNELSRRGYKFVYFYRPECAACDFVSPGLLQFAEKNPGSVAFVRFHKDSALPPVARADHWAYRSTPQRHLIPVALVPSLLVLDQGGLVRDAAHSDARRVLRVLLFHNVDEVRGQLERIDSARTARLTLPPAKVDSIAAVK